MNWNLQVQDEASWRYASQRKKHWNDMEEQSLWNLHTASHTFSSPQTTTRNYQGKTLARRPLNVNVVFMNNQEELIEILHKIWLSAIVRYDLVKLTTALFECLSSAKFTNIITTFRGKCLCQVFELISENKPWVHQRGDGILLTIQITLLLAIVLIRPFSSYKRLLLL
jgi:hypothetical protein